MTDDAARKDSADGRTVSVAPDGLVRRLHSGWSTALARLFGDRTGLAVFLVAVVVLGSLWRIDFLLNDSETVANLLANVASGRLSVVEAPYSLTAGQQPGLVDVDGRLYGRNYGQVYLAVPLLWLLDVLTGLVDLRLLLAAGWSLAVVGLARTLADVWDRPQVSTVGSLLALVAFGLSALVATRIDWYQEPLSLVALGLSTLLLAAVGATTLYRLLVWAHDRRVGVAGGLALVVATPVGFWGSFPKRHVLTATALLLVCFLFAISRTVEGRNGTLARGGAYAVVGFLASVHAFEAAFALAVLAPIDLLSAPANDRRTLAVVAAVFLVSLAPVLATNAAISGDPLQPPRTLPGVDEDVGLQPGDRPGGSGDAGGGTGGGPGSSSDGSPIPLAELLAPILGFLAEVWWIGTYMLDATAAGVRGATELDRLWHVFVRSGWIPGLAYHHNGFEAYDLAVLEALPLAGALAWLPVAVAARLRGGLDGVVARLRAGLADPVRQTDLLAGGLALVYLVVYLPYLPLYATITVRYVVPAMPLFLYGVCRLAPVRAAVREAPRALLAGTVATLGLGGVGFVAVLALLDPAVGEAAQLHALVGLASAVVLGGVVATWPGHRRARVVAGALALATGTTVLFVTLSALVYFTDGHHALDLVRVVAGVFGGPG